MTILNWQEALVFVADVDHITFWGDFEVVPVIDEKGDSRVLVKIAGPKQKTVNALIGYAVKELSKRLDSDGLWNLDIRAV